MPNLYKIYNIGNTQLVKLLDFIEAIENTLGINAIKEMLPTQTADMSDISQYWKSHKRL